MIFRRLGIINKDQKGFTLVELILAVAVTSLITLGIVMTFFQVFGGHARSSGEMTVIRQVQNAGYYISRDAQMAQTVDTGASSGFPLTLTWTEYLTWTVDEIISEEHQAVYTLVGDQLKREHYTDRETNPDPDATTFVADYIDSISSQCAGDKLTLTVTASIGGWKPQSETRTYEVTHRAGQEGG